MSTCLLLSHLALSQLTGQGTAALRKHAQLLMEQGRIEESLPLLQQALLANPRDVQTNLLLGRTLQQMGRIPGAIAAYRTILAAEPANQAAALGLSSAYRAVFNYKQAESVLRGAIRAHPRNAEPVVALGELEMQLQHYDAAIAVLKRAVALAPTGTAALRDLGICYQLTGKSELAVNNFNRAVRHGPRSAAAYYFRAKFFADSNQNENAERDARKVLTLEPDNRPASLLLAKVLLRSGGCAEGTKLLEPLSDRNEKGLPQKPDAQNTETRSEELFQLARAYDCLKKDDLARATRVKFDELSHREEAARSARSDADHIAEQAGELARKNQLAPALQLLEQALQKDPENAAAHAQMAKINFSRGDVTGARAEIEAALRSRPYHPEFLYVLGRVMEKQGDDQRALEVFQQAVLVDPRESDAYYEMAQIHSRLGHQAEAVQALKSALQISPDDPDYRRALAALTNR